MTNKEAKRAARKIPFGGALPEGVCIGLERVAARQANRADMSATEKAVRREQLQRETGVL
jgi:hypothetical protein